MTAYNSFPFLVYFILGWCFLIMLILRADARNRRINFLTALVVVVFWPAFLVAML